MNSTEEERANVLACTSKCTSGYCTTDYIAHFAASGAVGEPMTRDRVEWAIKDLMLSGHVFPWGRGLAKMADL